MIFQATIDNDTVAAMPAVQFDGNIVIVDRAEQIEAACRDLQQSSFIGFDTETRPSFKVGVSHKVSLLQLSTEKTCYLFRLNRIRLDNRILKILGSNRIIKVGADVSGDIRSLHALRDFKEGGFLDLQQEAPRYGIEEKSLRKLSAITLGMRVSKAQRLSNWEAGTLTEQQREYAATDAWVCLRILDKLRNSGIEPSSTEPHKKEEVAPKAAKHPSKEKRDTATSTEKRFKPKFKRSTQRKTHKAKKVE